MKKNKRTRVTNHRLFKLGFNKLLQFYNGLVDTDLIHSYLKIKAMEPELSKERAAAVALDTLSEEDKMKLLKRVYCE